MLSPELLVETDPFLPYKISHALLPHPVYAAGFPAYPANFTRDVIEAGIIASRPDLLASQLQASAMYQGRRYDPHTGEEPGKPHHEVPGAAIPGREGLTTYNANDTAALFLIGSEGLWHLDKSKAGTLLPRLKSNIERAVDYIFSHLEDDFFVEYPPKGADGYALRVPYWKDSILPNSSGKEEPVYPVIYPLTQFIAARGLLSARRLLDEPALGKTADRMFRAGIKDFITTEYYVAYKDNEEVLYQASSDELHALAFIPAIYTDLLPLADIRARANMLETPFGYMCTPPHIGEQLSDQYHGAKVWTHEQAIIHYGATKFGLNDEAIVAASVAGHINEGQELLDIEQEENGEMRPQPAGNGKQLWAVAAKEYFAGRSELLNVQWL